MTERKIPGIPSCNIQFGGGHSWNFSGLPCPCIPMRRCDFLLQFLSPTPIPLTALSATLCLHVFSQAKGRLHSCSKLTWISPAFHFVHVIFLQGQFTFSSLPFPCLLFLSLSFLPLPLFFLFFPFPSLSFLSLPFKPLLSRSTPPHVGTTYRYHFLNSLSIHIPN